MNRFLKIDEVWYVVGPGIETWVGWKYVRVLKSDGSEKKVLIVDTIPNPKPSFGKNKLGVPASRDELSKYIGCDYDEDDYNPWGNPFH